MSIKRNKFIRWIGSLFFVLASTIMFFPATAQAATGSTTEQLTWIGQNAQGVNVYSLSIPIPVGASITISETNTNNISTSNYFGDSQSDLTDLINLVTETTATYTFTLGSGSYDQSGYVTYIGYENMEGSQYNYNVTINSLSFTTPAPGQPTGLTSTPVSSTSQKISWASDSGATSYSVLDSSGNVIAQGLTSTNYTVTALSPGTKYTYSVEALNSYGTSPPGSISFETITAPPGGVKVTGETSASVSLGWDASPGAASYNVYEVGQSSPVLTGITGTTATVGSLQMDTAYSFYVTSVNSAGVESANSSTASATTQAGTMPPPSNVTTSGTPGGSGTVTWTPSSSAPAGTTYTVSENGQPIGTTTGSTLTISNYDPNATYTVTASAPGYTTVTSPAPGGSLSWGMNANDILSNSSALVWALAPFVLLGLSFILVPRLIRLMRRSVGNRKNDSGFSDIRTGRDLGYDPPEKWSSGVHSQAVSDVPLGDVTYTGVNAKLTPSSVSSTVSTKTRTDRVSSDPIST